MKHTSHLIKGFALPLVIAIIALVAVIVGISYFVVRQQPVQEESMVKPIDDSMQKSDSTMNDSTMQKEGDTTMDKKDGTVMSEESMMKYSGAVLAGSKAQLLDFNKADYDKATMSGKLVVLYFYANWCPICKAEFPKMQAAFNELSTGDVIGFRVNYNDNETDADEKALAREHGVAYQHTKVFVRNGTKILKAPDSWDTNRYLSEINRRL